MKMTGFCLLLCAFVAGVFFGIWMGLVCCEGVHSRARVTSVRCAALLASEPRSASGDSISLRGPAGERSRTTDELRRQPIRA